ncbi:hypothetical protein FRB91_006204 [Serendipita sp. 411]|nr:hypothetical protein FRC16_004034 [Serendipita sp. 398]KAG8852642.1 hypothetical protein FRB91_006204 [Serendipita sp. 411]
MSTQTTFGFLGASLLSLPVEILYYLHLLALNPALPLTSKHLYKVFRGAPPSISAHYLFHRYSTTSKDLAGIISSVLRYPLCTLEVFKRFLSILPDEYRHLYPNPRQTCNAPPVLETPMRLFKLPKRLFRDLKQSEADGDRNESTHAFLKHLYNLPPITYPNSGKTQSMLPDSNSHNGYPLAKAVMARDTRLIRLLLAHKADPNRNGGISVLLAIKNRDLQLVKLIVEGKPQRKSRKGKGISKGSDAKAKKRNSSSFVGDGKDLVVVDNVMLGVAVQEEARDIVEWLVKEKGCVPDIKTLRSMG